MTADIHGFDKWLQEYRKSRWSDERALQQEADEYVRNYLKAKKQQFVDDDGFEEVGEDGFVTVGEQPKKRIFNEEDIDPLMKEVNIKRKHKKPSEGVIFEYTQTKRKAGQKKAKKLRYNIKKHAKETHKNN
ncbi:Ribosomal RNA-processing protein 7 C-terminal domain-containing protein [Entamoeba marina]